MASGSWKITVGNGSFLSVSTFSLVFSILWKCWWRERERYICRLNQTFNLDQINVILCFVILNIYSFPPVPRPKTNSNSVMKNTIRHKPPVEKYESYNKVWNVKTKTCCLVQNKTVMVFQECKILIIRTLGNCFISLSVCLCLHTDTNTCTLHWWDPEMKTGQEMVKGGLLLQTVECEEEMKGALPSLPPSKQDKWAAFSHTTTEAEQNHMVALALCVYPLEFLGFLWAIETKPSSFWNRTFTTKKERTDSWHFLLSYGSTA